MVFKMKLDNMEGKCDNRRMDKVSVVTLSKGQNCYSPHEQLKICISIRSHFADFNDANILWPIFSI